MAGSKNVLAHWRETGEWWNGDPGAEVLRWVDSKGSFHETLTPIDPLVPAIPVQTGYVEDSKEDWDVRIRKQRDIKVSLACGVLPNSKDLTLIKSSGIPYVPLHLQTGYAFGRSLLLAEEAAELVSALQLPAAAIADPFSLAGAVEFVRGCKRKGVKPLIGATLELTEGGEVVLIARNKQGYRNLSTLITECHLNEPRGYPLATWERIEMYSEGLICISGGDSGLLDYYLTRNDLVNASKVVEKLCRIFGTKHVFLEVERSFLPWQKRVESGIKELATKFGVTPVAGGAVTHARPDHFPGQDILVCIESLCLVEEVVGRKPLRSENQPKGIHSPKRALNAERYLRTNEEMLSLFHDSPDLLENTLRVAELCEVDVLPPRTKLPVLFPDEPEALRSLVTIQAASRYPKINQRLRGRIDREISRIVRLGYTGHFLVAQDFCRWADSQQILYSGRGSVVDSVVAYCLGLSRIDAFRHNLHFDRFLPEDGSKRPDIDLDFEAAHRDDVREYITRKYGEKHVATVAAFGAFCTRGIVREVGKVMGLPEETVSYLCKRLHGGVRPDELESALEKRPELRGSKIPKERFRWIFRLAQRLMDVPRNVRAHSSGVVISADPLEWTVPRMWGAAMRPGEDGDSSQHMQIIQWDKRSAKYYFDKFDILCLRGQDVLSGTQRQIRVSDPSFRVESLSLNDESSYRTMRSGQLIGIPQSASPAMRQAHVRLRTQDLQDASLVQAGIRPGVGGAVKINELIARRRGKPYSFNHPQLLRILGHTYGIIVFQEQVDQLLQDFAGYKSGEAEDIRDAIHKKRREGYAERIRQEVMERIVSCGYGVELAEEVYDLIAGFQGYGFAQGHALAFAEISVRSIYCQQNFPAPYFAALLNAQPAGYYGPTTIANEARIRGVPLLPPDVNLSESIFSVEDFTEGKLLVPTSAIRVGFNQISGLSAQTVDKILAARRTRLFYSIFDFALRVRPDSDELERMVLCGALDGMGINRRALLWSVPSAISYAETYGSDSCEARLPLDFPEPPVREDVPDFNSVEKAIRERLILGLDVQTHLMGFERERVAAKGVLSSAQASQLEPGKTAFVVGNPLRLRFPPTQSGKRVMFFDLEDETGLLNVTCFDDTYQRYGHTIVTNPYVTLFGEAQDRDGYTAFLATRAYPFRPRIQDDLQTNAKLPIKISDFLMS